MKLHLGSDNLKILGHWKNMCNLIGEFPGVAHIIFCAHHIFARIIFLRASFFEGYCGLHSK